MYDTARSEWQALANAGAEGAQGALPPSLSYPSDVLPTAGDSAGVGHSAVPNNAALLEEGQNESHLYGDIVGEDLDAPKTVQDRVADRDKIRLMKNFLFAVSLYLCMAMVVFFVPMFVPMAVDAALLVAYDAILWAFLAGLLVVFRLRDTNQFLLIGEEGEEGFETTTELGVLYRDAEEEAQEEQRREAVPPRYTLDDEDGEIGAVDVSYVNRTMGSNGGRRNSRSGNMNINASAAAQGVVVQPLPSPQTWSVDR